MNSITRAAGCAIIPPVSDDAPYVEWPESSLPFVDAPTQEIRASGEAAWEAIGAVMGGMSRRTQLGARLLGCSEQEAEGSPTAAGATFPGWRVTQSVRPLNLVFEGEHRFSAYRLAYRGHRLGEERSMVTAETRAAFPGLKGTAYETAVIRSRLHVLAVRRLLGSIRRRAEAG